MDTQGRAGLNHLLPVSLSGDGHEMATFHRVRKSPLLDIQGGVMACCHSPSDLHVQATVEYM
jgi:hypothetical protein